MEFDFDFDFEFEFDDAKDAANLRKHGVSLVLGVVIRRDYGEIRMNAFGYVEGRLFVCTYTRRETTVRLISVPKASRQEQRRWLS